MTKDTIVILTPAGIAAGLAGRTHRTRGIVTSSERDGYVWVHRLGDSPAHKSHRYAAHYWQPAPC